MSFDVLMQEPDGGSFGGASDDSGALAAGGICREGKAEPEFLGHDGHLDDIDQGWGVLYPVGRGDLLELVAPLVAWRREQIAQKWAASRRRGAPPAIQTWEIPVGWGAPEFLAKHYDRLRRLDQPRYLVLLGDLHEISLEFQQDLMSRAFVGRLCFQSDAEYTAYVTKIVASEKAPPAAERSRLLLWSSAAKGVMDSAVDDGHKRLVLPTRAGALDERNAVEIDEALLTGPLAEPGRETWAALRQLAADPRPSILLSLSHGAGSPRWDEDEQRGLQGGMKLSNKETLDAAQVGSAPFLPGGVWFYYACYGAGTPSESAYAPWIREIKSAGYWLGTKDVTGTLAKKPFVARQAQVALANPQGPNGVIAHADLAFSFAFRSYAGARVMADGAASQSEESPDYVLPVLSALSTGKKLGFAVDHLTSKLASIDAELLDAYADDAGAEDRLVGKLLELSARRSTLPAGDPMHEVFPVVDALLRELGENDKRLTLAMVADAAHLSVRALVARLQGSLSNAAANARLFARGQMWMTRQDVRGFILLGDPAASLRLGAPQAAAEARRTPSIEELFGFSPKVPTESAPKVTTGAADPSRIEQAIHEVIVGEAGKADIARRAGIDRAELDRLYDVYTGAGLAAIKAALGG